MILQFYDFYHIKNSDFSLLIFETRDLTRVCSNWEKNKYWCALPQISIHHSDTNNHNFNADYFMSQLFAARFYAATNNPGGLTTQSCAVGSYPISYLFLFCLSLKSFL